MIDPSLFAEHDDETLAGMHGIEVAAVAAQRAALTGTAEDAAHAPAEAPTSGSAAEPAEKPKRAQKGKPAPETPAAAPPVAPSRQVFRVEVPYDDTTSADVFRVHLMSAMGDAVSSNPAAAGAATPSAASGRSPGSAVKFIGAKPIKARLPGGRSVTSPSYGDIFIGAEADYLAEHHPDSVEPHPRPRR